MRKDKFWITQKSFELFGHYQWSMSGKFTDKKSYFHVRPTRGIYTLAVTQNIYGSRFKEVSLP